jgi:hypothetical protein
MDLVDICGFYLGLKIFFAVLYFGVKIPIDVF